MGIIRLVTILGGFFLLISKTLRKKSAFIEYDKSEIVRSLM